MKTNPNNLPESFCVYNDGSPEFKKFKEEHYQHFLEWEYFGRLHGNKHASGIQFGQLLTLSEFERLSKPEELHRDTINAIWRRDNLGKNPEPVKSETVELTPEQIETMMFSAYLRGNKGLQFKKWFDRNYSYLKLSTPNTK